MDRKRQKLSPGKTKKKLKLSTPDTTSHQSNLNFNCNKEVVIQVERLSESIVAEMTAGWFALPPEQTKKKLKLSTPKTKLHPSNPHFICDKEAVVQLDILSDSFVAEMTADGYALPLERVNETNDDALDINSLPNEIILKVFSYLTQNQLGQIARVCRRWNVLTKSPLLWRKVNVRIFSSDRKNNTVAKSFINGLPSCVTFIRLDFLKYGEDFMAVHFEKLCVKLHQNCPHLEEIILSGCAISNILPVVINFCTQFLQGVKKLVFRHCSFYDYSATVEFIDTSKIEVLDLYCCDFFHSCNIQFSKLPYLKQLRLHLTDVNDTWFKDGASVFNQLEVLDLGRTLITARTFLAIQRHGHNLKELYLCKVHLRDRDLNFNNFICTHLKTICLNYYSTTYEGVVFLIQSCPSLENIYVDEHVAEFFAAHPFAVANRCKTGIVKAIDCVHNHKFRDLDTIRCGPDDKDSVAGMAVWQLTDLDLCPYTPIRLIVSVAFGILTFIIVCLSAKLLFARYELNIRVFLYNHGLTFAREEDIDQDKVFAVFVSFSHADDEFVIKDIITVIERKDPNIRLCLHYRHFMAGEFILDNITRAVRSSKRTLLILTRNFLKSEWCLQEFRTGHKQSMVDKVHRIVAVKVGELPKKIDPTLQVYLDCTTYLVWGEVNFWNKLLFVLPTRNAGKNKTVVEDCPDL